MPSSKRGLFIVFEGPDKSGKSTQARLLAETLAKRGLSALHTREPGGTSFAEEVRRILLNPDHRVHPLAELLLYEASRAQHTNEKILPALSAGKIVVCERYTLSTQVYQGHARGLDMKTVDAANALATGGLEPDLTFVLDIPPADFETRDAHREHDRLELEPASFRARVREGYQKLASKAGAVVIDGRRPVDEVRAEIEAAVDQALTRSRP